MCGIFGLAGDAGAASAVGAAAGVGVATLCHRGPDDHGSLLLKTRGGGAVLLEQTRLSIIDLTAAGHQPMRRGASLITFNGEIYNFLELRKELEKTGRHRFVSKTDTEVLLAAYQEWDKDCLEKLNGIFAFAIWDEERGRLLLARDRFGIKPLYFGRRAGELAFASEIKALRASGRYGQSVDWQALWDYFTLLHFPFDTTAWTDIRQLEPGCYLEFDPDTGSVERGCYFDIVDRFRRMKSEATAVPEAEWLERLRATLGTAVRRQMVSDVPLGAFLSGGVDSAVLVGLMARCNTRPVQTFTVRFTGSGVDYFNEHEAAARTARMHGCDHHELTVDVSALDDILEVAGRFDQPFANPTLYLSYLISKETRKHVTVALSGGGGDELFAGYPRYRALHLGRWAKKVPRPLLSLASASVTALSQDTRRPFWNRVRRFLSAAADPLASRYLRWVYYMDESQKRAVFHPPATGPMAPTARWMDEFLGRVDARVSEAERVMLYDMVSFLPSNILEYTDRTSMAVALEVRVPYLDNDVVDLSLAMPFGLKYRGGSGKQILRTISKDLIPRENQELPKKGFCPPLVLWMKTVLDGYFDRVMTKPTVEAQGLFDWQRIDGLREELRTGRADTSMELFSLIAFDAWYRKNVSG